MIRAKSGGSHSTTASERPFQAVRVSQSGPGVPRGPPGTVCEPNPARSGDPKPPLENHNRTARMQPNHTSALRKVSNRNPRGLLCGRTGASPAELPRNSLSSAALAALVTTRPPIGTERTFAVSKELEIRGSKSATFQMTRKSFKSNAGFDHSLTMSTTGRWIPKTR